MSDYREVAEWDWVQFVHGDHLHHPAELDHDDWTHEEVQGHGRASCGRRGWMMIPGTFSRLGAPRCRQCCAAVGYPPGTGSPKNDDALRPLVEARLARVA